MRMLEKIERATRLFKAAGLRKQPRSGLVPESGDPEHPYRWVRPEQAQGGAQGQAPAASPYADDDPRGSTLEFLEDLKDDVTFDSSMSDQELAQEAIDFFSVEPGVEPPSMEETLGVVQEWRRYQGDVQSMKAARDPFAVATTQAQKVGYSDFSEGSEGAAKRDEIAEAVKEGKTLIRRVMSLATGFRRVAKS